MDAAGQPIAVTVEGKMTAAIVNRADRKLVSQSVEALKDVAFGSVGSLPLRKTACYVLRLINSTGSWNCGQSRRVSL